MSDLLSDLIPERGTLGVFGERLKARRNFLGLTQEFIAHKTGISLASIQSYERGKIPKGDYLLVLSDLLECSIDWLLKGTDSRGDALATAQPPGQVEPPPAPPPPEEDFKITDMVTKAVEILESNTTHRMALASVISSLHQAVRSERTLAKLEERVALLEQRMEEVLTENQELKQRKNEQLSQSKAVGA